MYILSLCNKMAVTFGGLCLLLYTNVATAISCYRSEINWIAYTNSDRVIYRSVVSDVCTKATKCCGSYCCATYDDDSYYYYYKYYNYDSVSTGEIAAVTIGCVVGFTILVVCLRILCLCCRDSPTNETNTRNNVAIINTRTSRGTTSREDGIVNLSFNNSSGDIHSPTYTPYAEPPPSYEEVIKSEQMRNNGASPFPLREMNSTASGVESQVSHSGVILTPPSPNSI